MYDDDWRDVLRSTLTPVNTVIIGINVVLFLWMLVTGHSNDIQYIYEHGAEFWPDIVYGHEYSRLFTAAFLHYDISHIFNNMLVLAFIGDNMERALGSVKYGIFYVLTVLASGAVSTAWHMFTGSYAVSAGASGAVFGVAGGLIVLLVLNKGRLEDLSTRQVGLFIVFSIYHGISSAGVDNAAHLGGMAAGAVLAFVMYYPSFRRKRKYWS